MWWKLLCDTKSSSLLLLAGIIALAKADDQQVLLDGARGLAVAETLTMTESTFDASIAFNDETGLYNENIKSSKLMDGFYELTQTWNTFGSLSEHTWSQKITFDANNEWFSLSYTGEEFPLWFTSIGQGNIVERQWPDADAMIYLNVVLSDATIEQTIKNDNISLIQRVNIREKTWWRRVLTAEGDKFEQMWSFTNEEEEEVVEETNVFEVSVESEPSSNYDVIVEFEDAFLFVEKLTTTDDSLTQTIELREPERRTIETEYWIIDDEMWVEVTDSILGSVVSDYCSIAEGQCFAEQLDVGPVTLAIALVPERGLFRQMLRINDLQIQVFSEVDVLAREQIWLQKLIHEPSMDIKELQFNFEIDSIKDHEVLELPQGGELWTLERHKNVFDCRLAYEEFGVELFEESTVIGQESFKLDYRVADGSENPMRMNITFDDFDKMELSLGGEETQLISTECDGGIIRQVTNVGKNTPVSIGAYCDSNRVIYVALVFTPNNVPVRMYHKIDHARQEWEKRILMTSSAFVAYENVWSYEAPVKDALSELAVVSETIGEAFDGEFVFNDNLYIQNHVEVINSTALLHEVTLSDHANFYHRVQQVLSFNETDWRQVVEYHGQDVISLVWDKEKKMNFTSIEPSEGFKFIQMVDLTLNMVNQEFSIEEFDFKLSQTMHLKNKVWAVEILGKYDSELYVGQWDVKSRGLTATGTLDAPKPEPEPVPEPEPEEEEDEEEIDETRDIETDDGLVPTEPEPETINVDDLIDRFYVWAANQRIPMGLTSCNFDIEQVVPFAEAPDIWSIWANHDCNNWGVRLNLVLEREVTEDVIAFSGVNYSAKGCKKVQTTTAVLDDCEFEIHPGATNFALLIKDGFRPVWYEYEWVFIGNWWFLSKFYPW